MLMTLFLSDTKTGPKQVLPFQVRVDPAVMAMKGYSKLAKDPEHESDRQMQFNIIFWRFVDGVLLLNRDAVSISNSCRRLRKQTDY